jgi:hypothetical protein
MGLCKKSQLVPSRILLPHKVLRSARFDKFRKICQISTRLKANEIWLASKRIAVKRLLHNPTHLEKPAAHHKLLVQYRIFGYFFFKKKVTVNQHVAQKKFNLHKMSVVNLIFVLFIKKAPSANYSARTPPQKSVH